jgi:bifunctional enzyme CysN/CysC
MTIDLASPRPAAQSARSLVRIVIVGHVDHGKSTLIGRLLHETGSLPDGKLEALKAMSARRGMPFEWSFLLDALQTERDQGITIDTSQIRFRTPTRDIVLIDAPGHAEFLRNMITGAAQADAAILMIDAAEGVRDQTRRHGYLLHLLGVRQVAVAVNKMDRVGFDAVRFADIRSEIVDHLTKLGVTPTAVIPISARNGDGVTRRTAAIAWHAGPTVLEALDAFTPARATRELSLRLPIQAIYKFDDRRILAGRVETGRIAVGDEIVIMPGRKAARVRSIEAWPVPDDTGMPRDAAAGQSIGLTLDRELFVERGHVVSTAAAPSSAGRRLRARIFWLHQAPLTTGDRILVRLGTAESAGTIRAIEEAIDPGDLEQTGADAIAQNHVGVIDVALDRPIAADPHDTNPALGRIVLEHAGRIAGGGLVLAVEAQHAPGARARDGLGAQADRIGDLVRGAPAGERIAWLRREIDGRIVFTTGFGLEDQVITHLMWERDIDVDLVTLDTGRLFPETYALWAETERRYGRRIRAIHPRHDDLEALVARQGASPAATCARSSRSSARSPRPAPGSRDCAPSNRRGGAT